MLSANDDGGQEELMTAIMAFLAKAGITTTKPVKSRWRKFWCSHRSPKPDYNYWRCTLVKTPKRSTTKPPLKTTIWMTATDVDVPVDTEDIIFYVLCDIASCQGPFKHSYSEDDKRKVDRAATGLRRLLKNDYQLFVNLVLDWQATNEQDARSCRHRPSARRRRSSPRSASS